MNLIAQQNDILKAVAMLFSWQKRIGTYLPIQNLLNI